MSMRVSNEQLKALMIIDVQNDFCPGGALAVPHGDEVIDDLNKYIEYFHRMKWPIIATRDWHPANTTHFVAAGGQWPEHCVEGTQGAQFHPKLELPKETIVLSKGTLIDQDGYSAFQGVDEFGKDPVVLLENLKIKRLVIGGLATDYCVKETVFDAIRFGFSVQVAADGICGIDEEDSQSAIESMVKAGAEIITFKDLIK